MQDKAFLEGEGDRYWRRNRDGIGQLKPHNDIPLRLLEMYGIRPKTALEVGAANGYRLCWLDYLHGTRCLAVEPSAEAIAYGETAHPWIRYLQSTAADMDVQGETFDLVIVNYVFHWIDRSRLMQSVANIDKAVKPGGHLLVGDFYPSNRHRVAYHHQPGLWTYKQDYARLFLETGLYHAVGMLTTPHGTGRLETGVPEMERYACWLLEKDPDSHYVAITNPQGAIGV